MNKMCRRSAVVVAVIITLTVVAPVRAGMVSSDSPVPYLSVAPQVENTIERTASVALRHISQARADIHRKALPSARRELSEASRLMTSIRDNLSTATARNFIQIARKHLEYEPAPKIVRDLRPISASLEKISMYLPTDKAQAHLNRAKRYLEKNDKQRADRELAAADSALLIIEVELPLLRVQQYVNRAKDYLVAKNLQKADEALQSAERRAFSLFITQNTPLYEAKQNIWLAFWNYSTAGLANALIHLEKARTDLSRAAADGNTKGKEETGKLSREVADLEKSLAGETAVAESQVKAVWEKCKALAERSGSYLAAAVAEKESTAQGENYLIEAGLHLAYAETYQMTTAEPDKAVRELERAYSYLQKATKSSLLDPGDLKKIRSIESILLELKSNPEKHDTSVQERYDSVQATLIDLKTKEEMLDEDLRIM